MGTFSYTFTTPNTVLNLTDNGAISIKTPSSANTPGTGTYNITITETASGKSYKTNVAVNVETLCKSIDLIVGTNNTTNYLTNYKSYTLAYNVQYNSGNNYIVSDKYCKATYTINSDASSSGVTMNEGNLSIPQLYEGTIKITANNQNNKSEKTITTTVFKPKVTLNTKNTTYGTAVTLTYSVESNAAVGTVTFDGAGKGTYYTINGQTLTPLKAGATKIKTQYAKSNNFLAYTSNDIDFTINKRTGTYEFNNIESTYGNGNFSSGLTYSDWFGSIIYSTGGTNSSITVDDTGYVRVAGAGTTTVTATGTGDNNHEDFKASADITIKKRSATSYKLADATCTYGDSPFNMKLTYSNWYGTPKYNVTDGSDYIDITELGNVTIKGAGSASVTVTGTGDKNHYDFTYTANVKIDERTGTFSYSTKYLSYANKGTNYPIGLTYTNWFGTIAYTITEQDPDALGNTISLNGDKINILNAGAAKIKVTATGDKNHKSYTAYINCNVSQADRTFRFAESTKTIIYGSNYNLIAYEGNTSTHIDTGITYTTSKETIATVNNGVVTPLAYGQTTIRGTWAGGRNYKSYYADVIINVERKDAILSINDVTVTYNPSKTEHQLSLSKETNGTITYSSSNENIATVSDKGVVTIKGAGSNTTITVISKQTNQYNRKETSCRFTVNKAKTELIVSTSSNPSSHDGNYNYNISNNPYVPYVLYVSVLDKSNGNAKLSITADDINVNCANHYLSTTRPEKINDTVLKYTFSVEPNVTNETFETLTFTFISTRFTNYYEDPGNRVIQVKVNKETADISATVSNTSIYKDDTSTITVSNVNNRYISAKANRTLVTVSEATSNNIITVTAKSNPSSDTDVNITITAAENAYYKDSNVVKTIKVKYKSSGTSGGGTQPPSDDPNGGNNNNNPTSKEPYLVVEGQVSYGTRIVLNPAKSTKSFSVMGHNVTGAPTVSITGDTSNINQPASLQFIAYNGCTLELKQAINTNITFSCNDSGFISSVPLEINYGTTDPGGSITPDGSVTPGGDEFAWANTYINEVAYVVISNTATSPTAIGVADVSNEIICSVMGKDGVPLVGGNADSGTIDGKITSLSASSASITWTVTNANGNYKTIYSNYSVIKGDFVEASVPPST